MTSKQKFTFFLKRGLLHVAVPMLPTFRLMEASLLIFQPKKWNFTSILWCLELSAGFVALISMSLYWDAYAAFRITPKDSYVGAGKYCLCLVVLECVAPRNEADLLLFGLNSLEWLAANGLCLCMAAHARGNCEERNTAHSRHCSWRILCLAWCHRLQLVL